MAEHKNLAAALAAFQAELPRLKKDNVADTGAYTYKYADLADVSQAVLPVLGKHGLSFSAKPTVVEGKFVLAYCLRHEHGDKDEGVYPLPAGSQQQVGSAISYGRRYALSALTGIAPDADDDGKTAPDVPEVSGWDPQVAEGFEEEIRLAKSPDELTEIANRVAKAKRNDGISKPAFDHLIRAGAARRAELDQPMEAQT